MALILGPVDAAAGVYLLAWALRRERRDKPAVAIVGGALLVCAAVLIIAVLVRDTRPTGPSDPGSPSVAPSTVGV